MATNINLKKKHFIEDLMYHLAKLHDGPWRYRNISISLWTTKTKLKLGFLYKYFISSLKVVKLHR